MPIYEYTCGACGHEFEVLQKITDKPVRKCEKCGKLKAARHISQTSFVLKGTGWYTTDYAGKKAHAKTESDGGSTPSVTEATAKPAESKPAESKPSKEKTASV